MRQAGQLGHQDLIPLILSRPSGICDKRCRNHSSGRRCGLHRGYYVHSCGSPRDYWHYFGRYHHTNRPGHAHRVIPRGAGAQATATRTSSRPTLTADPGAAARGVVWLPLVGFTTPAVERPNLSFPSKLSSRTLSVFALGHWRGTLGRSWGPYGRYRRGRRRCGRRARCWPQFLPDLVIIEQGVYCSHRRGLLEVVQQKSHLGAGHGRPDFSLRGWSTWHRGSHGQRREYDFCISRHPLGHCSARLFEYGASPLGVLVGRD